MSTPLLFPPSMFPAMPSEGIVTAPVVVVDDIALTQYDRKSLSWKNASGNWLDGDLAGATVTLTLFDRQTGLESLQAAMTIDVAVGIQQVSITLTPTQTGSLHREGKQYDYQVLMVSADGTTRETPLSGAVTVTLCFDPPAQEQ